MARQFAVAFGIAILFPMLVFHGISLFHPFPKFESQLRVEAVTIPRTGPQVVIETPRQIIAERERHAQQAAYDAATKGFFRTFLIFGTPLGLAAIFIGCYLALHSVGTGLILGGVATVWYGFSSYWQYFDDWFRVVSLLVGLGILAFVGYRQVVGARGGPPATPPSAPPRT
jgi:hypothetical protein